MDKFECARCGTIGTHHDIFCPGCGYGEMRKYKPRSYMTHYCGECGSKLDIWLDQLEEERPAEGDGFRYERRHLMWHCAECGCDYENYWETQWGDTMESMPRRKYWG